MFNYPLSPCATCIRLTAHMNPAKETCQAFPKGIPTEILDGIDKDRNPVTHTSRHKDQDNDLLFLDIDDLSMEEIEAIQKQKK